MPGYMLSQAADDDLAAIAIHTVDQFGIDQAIAYRDGLIQTFAFLAEFPHVARERHELHPLVRAYPFRAHLILYRIDGDGILIQRIRHGREDWVSEPIRP